MGEARHLSFRHRLPAGIGALPVGEPTTPGFFKVHPGFLVDDPEGYQSELTSDLRAAEGQLDGWLLQAAVRFASDRELSDALLKVARQEDTRACVLLLGAIVDTPGLAERLLDALRPQLTRSAASGGSEEGTAL